MYFDGSSRLTMPDSADFDFGSGNWTVECWFFDTVGTRTNTQNGLFNQSAGGATSDSAFFLGAGNNGLSIYLSTSGSSWTNSATTSVAPKVNTWSHLVWQRNGNTLQMFLNGISQTVTGGSSSFSGTIFNSSRLVEVASQNNQSWVTGIISDMRVVKGTAVYTSNFTPPTAPLTAITNTSLLLSGTNAGIIDKSQSAKNLTLQNGLKSSTTQTKYLSSSMNFTDNLAELFYAEDADFFAKDFTIEAWIWSPDIDNGGTNNMAIFDWRPTNTNGNYVLLWVAAANSSIGYWVNGSYRITGNTTLSDSTWHHIAVSRQGSTHRMFIDGTLQTSTWTDSGTYLVPTNRPIIGNSGYHRTDNAFDFNGYMSDIRFTKGLARYTANFTPPTAALQG